MSLLSPSWGTPPPNADVIHAQAPSLLSLKASRGRSSQERADQQGHWEHVAQVNPLFQLLCYRRLVVGQKAYWRGLALLNLTSILLC